MLHSNCFITGMIDANMVLLSFFNRFSKDLCVMIGHEPSWYWKILWAFISPILIISLFVFYITDYIRAGIFQYQAWDATEVFY